MMHTPRSRNAPKRSMLCSTGAVFWKPNTIAVLPDLRMASMSWTLSACATRSLLSAMTCAPLARRASVSLAFSQTETVVLTHAMAPARHSSNHWRSGVGIESPSTMV